MADGSVIFDTELDATGLRTGLAKMASIAAKGVAATVAALGGLSVAAVKIGSDFEAQMSRVNAISGATQDEFAQLTELAKELGAETAFSASEAAAGMENLASAGFDANQIMSAMPGLLDLAAVSGGDVAAASEVAASALNAFGLEADQAGHVANVFAAAAAATNAETLDMGDAMKYVAPVAKAMGLSLEQTAAAIGIMSDAGVKGSQAGTALRGALSRLARPTDAMTDKMDKLGLSFYDAEGNMISLDEQVLMLKEKFADLTQEEQNNALVTLYGQEALSGMLALIEAGPEKLNELTESFENSAGAAEEMAEKMLDNLQGDIEALGGSAETLGITFSEKVNAPLRELVQLADGYVQDLNEALSLNGLEGLADAAGSVLASALAEVSDFLPRILSVANSIIKSLVSSIKDNAGRIVTSARNILSELVDGITEAAPEFLDAVLVLIQKIGLELKEAIPELLPKLISSVSDLLKNFSNKGVPIILKAVANIISGVARALPSCIKEINNSLDEILEGVISGILDAAPDLIFAVLELVASVIATALNPVEIVNSLLNIVSGVINGVVNGLAGAFGVLTDEWDKESYKLSEKALETADNVAGLFASGLEKAQSYMSSISSAGTIFDDFNKNILFSAEKEQEIATQMDSVQSEITAIAQVASDERRSLTESEIARLDELFEQMRKLTERELELQRTYGEVATSQAEALASTFEGTASAFAATAQTYLNSAEEAKNNVIALAEQQYAEEVALLNLRLETDAEYNDAQYQADITAALERKDAVVQAAAEECAETYAIIAQGYADRAELNGEAYTAVNDYNKQIEEENTRHNEELKRLTTEYNNASLLASQQLLQSGYTEWDDYWSAMSYASEQYNKEKERLETEHNSKLQTLQEEQLAQAEKSYDEQNVEYMAMYIAMLAQAELYGADITEEQKRIADNILAAYDALPDDAKEKFKETGEGMLEGLKAKEGVLFEKASSIANGIINRFSNIFDINSPSKVMRKLFGYVMDGGILGIDDGEGDMLSKAAEAAKGTRDCFDEYLGDLNYEVGASLVTRMQNAVDENHNVTRNIASVRSDDYFSDYDSDDDTSEDNPENNPQMLQGDVYLDGKKVGKVISPYVSKQLAWEGK